MTIIEQMARAIAECRRQVRNDNDAALAAEGYWPDRHKQPTDLQYATAALTALLEPHTAMTDAARFAYKDSVKGQRGVSTEVSAIMLRAAIQAALDGA